MACDLIEESRHTVLFDKADRTEGDEDQEHSDHKTEIADAIHDECLLGGIARGFAPYVVTDQQIRAEPYSLPADEQKQQVVGQHQRQHHEHEQIEISEKPVEPGIAVHVADGIDVYQQSDASDEKYVES